MFLLLYILFLILDYVNDWLVFVLMIEMLVDVTMSNLSGGKYFRCKMGSSKEDYF